MFSCILAVMEPGQAVARLSGHGALVPPLPPVTNPLNSMGLHFLKAIITFLFIYLHCTSLQHIIQQALDEGTPYADTRVSVHLYTRGHLFLPWFHL